MPAMWRKDLLKALMEPKPLSIATCKHIGIVGHQQCLGAGEAQQIEIFAERHASRFLEDVHCIFRMQVRRPGDIDGVDVLHEIGGDEIAHR